jgi:probable F420-dependent oxidoreductase
MARHTMRIGVQLQPQHTTWEAYRSAVQQCDTLGVDTIWTWDHFFPLTGDPQGSHFEGWTLLSAMAALTTRAEVGCLVTCNSYRNPALLAAMAKTVDHISGGRLILGLGAGWFERDYTAYGYHFGTAVERLAALRQAVPLIRERWQYDAPPATRPIPLLIGGSGEKVTLKLTAQYADMWNGLGTPEDYARKNQVLTTWCQQLDRDPQAVERTVWMHHTALLDRPELLTAYAEAGATHMIVGLDDPFAPEAVQLLVRWRDQQA